MEISEVFVVKRPFKSNGQHFASGSIVEPGDIRLFRNKVNEGKVVRLNEQSIDNISLYIKRRTGNDVTQDLKDTLDDARADMAAYFVKMQAAESEELTNNEDIKLESEERTDVTGTDVTGTDVTNTVSAVVTPVAKAVVK